jgi:hypothetical protein
MKSSEQTQINDHETIQCTCGFNFLVNEASDRTELLAACSNKSQSQPSRGLHTEDLSNGLNGRVHSGSLRTMDSSFVQVPASDVLLTVEAATFQCYSGQASQHNTSIAAPSVSNKEDCENGGSRLPFKWSNYICVHSASKLYRISNSSSDFPALCRRCIRRYDCLPNMF